MKKWISMLALVPALWLTTACEKKNDPIVNNPGANDPLEKYQLIGTQASQNLGYTVDIYALEMPFPGYNPIVAQVRQTGTNTIVNDAHVQFKPMMKMNSGMEHACPIEQPAFSNTLKGYEGSCTFVMPSMMGTWTLNIEVTPKGAANSEMLSFPINVMEDGDSRIYDFMHDGTGYFVALVAPREPEVGINDYEIVIYKRVSMMEWPAVENLNVEIEPWMPSMNHGSTGSVHPVHSKNGHYLGKVSFNMNGVWEVRQKIMDESNQLLDEGYFEIQFQ